jgi:curved DNA-binding protein CbpA
MPSPAPLSGKLDENSLPGILTHLHGIKASGTLSLAKDSTVKNLYIKNGEIIFASSNYEGDRLGEVLLKAGKISVKQFDMASKVMSHTKKRLGGILVELGYLKAKDLFWGVKYQVQEIVASLFGMTEGSYEFIPGEIPPGEVITLHMSTANLIMQGVKRIDDWTRISRGIPLMETVLRPTSDPMKLYQDIDLSDEEKIILSLFDGKRTIKDAISQSRVGDFEALKAVYVFYSIGMLEKGEGKPQRNPQVMARLEAEPVMDRTAIQKAYFDAQVQDHYEVLDLDSEASQEEIELAYRRLARLYHPDGQFTPGMEKLAGELGELFAKVSEAYAILSNDSRRWEYDLSLATVMTDGAPVSKKKKPRDAGGAKDAFEEGIESFKKKDFEAATVHFKEATRLDSTNASYFSYMALALLQRPRREAEAEEAMLTAVELEPEIAEHRANLGLLYQKAGIRDKAKDAFEAALRLDPKNKKALKGLGRK